MIKTGIISFLAVSVVSLNVILDTYYPFNRINENFYLYKDFISCVCLFVLLPTVLIVRNQTIKENCKKWILSAQVFNYVKETFVFITDNVLTLKLFLRNTVHPNWHLFCWIKLVKRMWTNAVYMKNMSSFLQSHPPITETFRSYLKIYLYNMFLPSTMSSSGTNDNKIIKMLFTHQKLIKNKHWKKILLW